MLGAKGRGIGGMAEIQPFRGVTSAAALDHAIKRDSLFLVPLSSASTKPLLPMLARGRFLAAEVWPR